MRRPSPDLVFGTGSHFGRFSQSSADQLVSFALSQNVTLFDTSFEYCNGSSQQKLLQALRSLCFTDRSSFKFSTKLNIPKTFGVITNKITQLLSSPLQYVDYFFICGSSVSELSSPFLIDELNQLKDYRLINSIGVNSCDLNCLNYILENIKTFPVDHIMLDFNLLRQDKLNIMKKFSHHGVKVWVRSALCNGFLIQSLLDIILSTPGLFYHTPKLLHHDTRILLAKSKILWQFLRTNYPELCRIIPLQYVLQCESVDFIPLSMLSLTTISQYVQASSSLIPQSVILEVADWASHNVQLN